MEHEIVELYEPARLARLEKRCRLGKRLLWGLGLLALAVCVILTAQVNTHNIYKMLLACMCVCVGAACIIIYFGIYLVRDGGRELEHARHLADGPRQAVTGRVRLEKLKVRIRNSITLRKLRVDTENGPVRLSVHVDKAEQLRRAGEWLTLYTVHNYVVAYQKAEEGTAHADR